MRDEQVTEDLVSEGFLDVWRQAGKFEGRSAVSTWLLAITRFKALSALRRRKDVELDDEAANAIEESVEEVAEIFGIPGNTEKTRLFYARRKSAELLKAVGIERGWP